MRGAEGAVARAHGQPVRLPHDSPSHDLHGDVQIPDQAADDRQLLRILFSEDRHIGQHHVEQLGDHRYHTVEMTGPTASTQASGEPPFDDCDGSIRGIHGAGGGHEEHVDPSLAATPGIARGVTRIGVKILFGSKLRRIDKEADHH